MTSIINLKVNRNIEILIITTIKNNNNIINNQIVHIN